MSKVKQLLAGVLSASMIVTLMPAVTFAADDGATYTITSGSSTFTYTSEQYKTLSELLADSSVVLEGDTVTVTGTVTLGFDESSTIAKEMTIDLSGATVTGTMPGAGADYCLNSDAAITNVYNYAEHEWDVATIVINIPDEYNSAKGNGVTATISCSGNNELEYIDADDSKGTGYSLKVNESETKPTCEDAGSVKVNAAVVNAAGKEVASDSKDYGEVPALGHSYGTYDATTGITTPVGDSISIAWAVRGSGENIVADRDENGYTKITSAKVKCTRGDQEKAQDVVSATVVASEITVAPTTAAPGQTSYTVELVTKDGQTLKIVELVTDIPALGAQTPGEITEVALQYETYTLKDGEYVRDDTEATYEKASAASISGDYTQVEGTTYKKLTVAEDGSLNYRLTYTDAKNPSKTGYITGTWAPLASSKVYDCGHGTYNYAPLTNNVFTFDEEGNLTAVQIAYSSFVEISTVKTEVANSSVTLTGEHTLDDALTYTIDPVATHQATGKASIVCKYCGGSYDNVTVPKTTNHEYLNSAMTGTTQSASAAKVFTIDPTCTSGGYSFYLCTIQGEETAKSAKEAEVQAMIAAGYTQAKLDALTAYHTVKIEGSETDKLDHDFVLVSATTAGQPNTENAKDITWTIELACKTCGKTSEVTYHSAAAPSTGAIEGDVYSAITVENVAGEDCTKNNSTIYTIPDLSDLSGTVVKYTKVLDTKGAHVYTNKINWSADGKTATVARTCSLGDKCSDWDGKKTTTVTAVVTKATNADGSYTYTATYEDEVLGTKTVTDLSDAVITINNGEIIDANAYAEPSDLTDAVKKMIGVTIAGNEVSSSLYDIAVAYEPSEAEAGSDVTALTVTVSAKADTNAVNSKAKTLKTTDKNAQLVVYKTIADPTVKVNGKTVIEPSYEYGADVSVVATTTTKDVTIKYAVAEYTKNNRGVYVTPEEPAEADYTLDSVALTEVGKYDVYVKISGDKLTTLTEKIATIVIDPLYIPTKIALGKQSITYGEQLTASTGDADLDAKVGLTVKDTTKLGVGRYNISSYVTYDKNYSLTFDVADYYNAVFTVEKRNATIVMTEDNSIYNGQAVDKSTLFTIDGAINGDTLDVVVNTAGNKDIIDAGDYTLVATANDANYNIEKVTAVYTVKPASIVGMTVTPKKTSMVWTGKARKPGVESVVSGDGVALTTADYSVSYSNNINAGKNAKMIVKGKGNYTGSITTTFTITKAKQKVKSTTPATGKTKTYTATALKKANKTFTIKATASKEQGTAQFKKVSGNAKITLTSAGKVTVKKGLAKGTYTLKYKVRIKATKNCKTTAYVNKTVKIKVK